MGLEFKATSMLMDGSYKQHTAEHEHEYTHDHEGLITLSGRNSDIHI